MHGRGPCRICVRQTKPCDVKLNRNAAFFCARSARARHPARAMVPAWLGVSVLARAAAPVRLILDTDMGGGACRDVDDVVALCTLHAMMVNGLADTCAPGPPTCTYGLLVPAVCVLHIPEAQGCLPRCATHCTCAVRVPTSARAVRTGYRGTAG